MENILVIINFEDIEPALKVAESLASYRVYTYNPNLLDRIMVSGLKNVILLNWDDCIDFAELDKWSHQAGFDSETELDAIAQPHAGGASIQSWQNLSLSFLYATMRWYRGLWDGMADTLRNGNIHVFVCDNPAIFFSRSFLPAVMLLETLNARGIPFSAYSFENHPTGFSQIPALLGQYEGTASPLLTHMPTCVYDYKYFGDEMIAANVPVVNLETEFFNVPLPAHVAVGLGDPNALAATLPQELQEEIGRFTAALRPKVAAIIGTYIHTDAYVERQADSVVGVYRMQLVAYHLLQNYFRQRRPAKMLLSDHDAGLHGPLISYARLHNIPVLTVPHSVRTLTLAYTYPNITCLTHPIQGQGLQNMAGKNVQNFKLSFPETFSGSSHFPRLGKIAVLLNEISTEGIYYTKPSVYMEGVRAIAQWCAAYGVELTIRCKPSSMMLHSLSSATGLAIAPLYEACVVKLPEFVAMHDLCLMYDCPTSASLPFLRAGVPVLNPVPERLARGEELSCNTDIVPRGTVAEILGRLEVFAGDPSSLLQFRNAQFSNYIAAFKDALPLRAFL